MRVGYDHADRHAGREFVHMAVINDSAWSKDRPGDLLLLAGNLDKGTVFKHLELNQAHQDQKAPQGNSQNHNRNSCGLYSFPRVGHAIDD